jgi:hypothetical protein
LNGKLRVGGGNKKIKKTMIMAFFCTFLVLDNKQNSAFYLQIGYITFWRHTRVPYFTGLIQKSCSSSVTSTGGNSESQNNNVLEKSFIFQQSFCTVINYVKK